MATNKKISVKEKKRQEELKKKKILIGALILACVVAVIFSVIMIVKSVGKNKDTGLKAVIEVENYGTIEVMLDKENAPITVENFVTLSKDGFYNGLTFHRIMDGFMMQGGDPDGNGTGGSGKEIKGEFMVNGVNNQISHKRGTISMARNSISYDSASSQFFIVQSDSEFLDGQYAGFGTVVSGMDVVDKICKDAKPIDNNGTIVKEEQPIIKSITIEGK